MENINLKKYTDDYYDFVYEVENVKRRLIKSYVVPKWNNV